MYDVPAEIRHLTLSPSEPHFWTEPNQRCAVPKRALTSGGLGAVRIFRHVRQVSVPRVFHGRLEDLPAVQVLRGPEVVPQVLDGLDVVLLLGGEDGVEGLQLQGVNTEQVVGG